MTDWITFIGFLVTLLGFAAQLSGYTNPLLAKIIIAIGLLVLFGKACSEMKQYIEPTILIRWGASGTFFCTAIMLIGFMLQKSLPSPNTTSSLTPAATANTLAPQKFYSESDKNRLSDALFALNKILNEQGKRIYLDGRSLTNIWEAQNTTLSQGRMPDISDIKKKLAEINSRLTELALALFSENGVVQKYSPYSKELLNILGTDNPPKLRDYQIAINNLSSNVDAIERAIKHNDRALVGDMMHAMGPATANLTQTEDSFNGWVDESISRIDTFKNGLRDTKPK